MPFEDLLKSLVILLAVILVAAPAYVGFRAAMAWVRRYERRGDLAAGEPTEMQVRLDALEHNVAELQERLDFAERLLAQEREAGRLRG